MAIKYDSRNYRKHNERNKKLIKKSLHNNVDWNLAVPKIIRERWKK